MSYKRLEHQNATNYQYSSIKRSTNKQQMYKDGRVQKEKNVTIGLDRREKYVKFNFFTYKKITKSVDSLFFYSRN